MKEWLLSFGLLTIQIHCTLIIDDLLSIIKKFIIRTIWHADKAPAIYSASQVDNAITDYFSEHQEMIPSRYLKKYAEVLLMSTLSPHQSESK